MASAGPLRSQRHSPRSMHVHALDNLRFIRETMERATAFTAISGWGLVAVGLTALGAAALAWRQPPVRWLVIWLGEAAVAFAVAAAATVRKAHAARMPLFSMPARRFALSFSPPMAVGALLTLVLYRAGLVELLPGLWMLLYGTGIVTGGAFSIRVVPVMGVCFMVLGGITLFLPAALGYPMMVAGFGGLHLVFGSLIVRRYGG
ncbi:MAG: hypothetical protein ACP5U2_01890 [Bryobacteraceae bacterium]